MGMNRIFCVKHCNMRDLHCPLKISVPPLHTHYTSLILRYPLYRWVSLKCLFRCHYPPSPSPTPRPESHIWRREDEYFKETLLHTPHYKCSTNAVHTYTRSIWKPLYYTIHAVSLCPLVVYRWSSASSSSIIINYHQSQHQHHHQHQHRRRQLSIPIIINIIHIISMIIIIIIYINIYIYIYIYIYIFIYIYVHIGRVQAQMLR